MYLINFGHLIKGLRVTLTFAAFNLNPLSIDYLAGRISRTNVAFDSVGDS